MYPVDLHMHTVASTHAYSTLSDYIAEAKRKGIKLFAITDHGPDMEDAPHHWHFINMRIWPRLVDGVGILRGIEANIKNINGEIDCSGKMFDSLDLIIAGFHEPVFAPHDKETNTQAMIATIASGKVHIISHPGNPKCRNPLILKNCNKKSPALSEANKINHIPRILRAASSSSDNSTCIASNLTGVGSNPSGV